MEDNYSGCDDQNIGVVSKTENIGVVRVCREPDEVDIGEEEQEVLKRRISGHPLYGLLMENHINCLKVGLGEMGEVGEVGVTSTGKENSNTKLKAAIIPSTSELDQFMEAYCNALKMLKESMEEPLKEAASFITATYAQLEELGASKKAH